MEGAGRMNEDATQGSLSETKMGETVTQKPENPEEVDLIITTPGSAGVNFLPVEEEATDARRLSGATCIDLFTAYTYEHPDAGQITYDCTAGPDCSASAEWTNSKTGKHEFFIPLMMCCSCGGGLRQSSKFTPPTKDCSDLDTATRDYSGNGPAPT